MIPNSNTGGPAFPRASATVTRFENDHEERETHVGHDGMSLRQWYAGQALAGMLAAYSGGEIAFPPIAWAAKTAFEYADAMIAESEKEREG